MLDRQGEMADTEGEEGEEECKTHRMGFGEISRKIS